MNAPEFPAPLSPSSSLLSPEQAIGRASALIRASRELEGGFDPLGRQRRARMRSLVHDPDLTAFTVELTDTVARIADPAVAAGAFAHLTASRGLRGLGGLDRLQARAGALLAPRTPALVARLITERLRWETRGMILASEDPALRKHLAKRLGAGFHSNVNVLGEAILGEGEADRRLSMILGMLARPDLDYVSVKISAISSQISALAFDATVEGVAARLRTLYRAAMAHTPSKFVNLDMEEYRDLELTIAVFRKVLDEVEFRSLDAGIVVQAYLPDAHDAARELAEWARSRRLAGGGRVKVRVVKGANLAMETVEAELRGWELAPYATKAEVDASYKAVLDTLLEERYDDAVRVGLASHNLFDIAWGLELLDGLQARGAGARLDMEMLEGMAPAQSEAVRDAAKGMLLYAPVVARSDFAAAIAYLVRRLDENTTPENFLSKLYDIEARGPVFDEEAERFRASVHARGQVRRARSRTQDRNAPSVATPPDAPFTNEPDTDFALGANRSWIASQLNAWRPPSTPVGTPAPHDARTARVALTASPFGSYEVAIPDHATVDRAVETARTAGNAWRQLPWEQRRNLVHAVGDAIAARRGEILATMAHDAGKTIGEGDPEISEAIDFARYYAASIERIEQLAGEGADSEALGTIVVAPPWNFPFAIPMGGVLAALAAGSAVILKPATPSTLTGSLVAEACWAAGLPRELVQFLPCPDHAVGEHLISHPGVDGVILTGSHATASMFLGWKPSLRLHAETSGKNALVIGASADVDNAIRDLVRSAFGHAGQKCSAASLAIVDHTLYDDAAFLERLRDAVTSLRTGPGFDLSTDVGPVINPPTGDLLRALTTLEEGESWLVEPQCLDPDTRRLWTPGVRIGVQPGSWYHLTECFGPVLGILRAESADHALALQNQVDYGLTAGLHSLDDTEIDRWIDGVQAGNLYVNRGTTGAIVRRQPFGGWKRSVVGPTVKAGGPNYVASLRRWHDASGLAAQTVADTRAAFAAWAGVELGAERDPSGLRAESNVLRWRALPGGVAVRCGADADPGEVDVLRAAAEAVGVRAEFSQSHEESEEAFTSRLGSLGVDRVRLIGAVGDAVRAGAHALALPVDDASPVRHPAVELPRWLREQSVTHVLHRHGHLPAERATRR